jgi:hypothetical protein
LSVQGSGFAAKVQGSRFNARFTAAVCDARYYERDVVLGVVPSSPLTQVAQHGIGELGRVAVGCRDSRATGPRMSCFASASVGDSATIAPTFRSDAAQPSRRLPIPGSRAYGCPRTA